MRKDVANEITMFKGDIQLLNKSELARRYNCDRRTVDKYLVSQECKRKPREYDSILNDFQSIIIDKVDSYGSSSMAVYKFIQKKGYSGRYGTVNNFVKKHKKKQQGIATIRFETTPGLQAQVDWKESLEMVNVHGEVFRINIFLMVLGFSRYKFAKITSNKTQKVLFECMLRGFQYFQGVPKEIIFDNMATVVDRKSSAFKSITINKTFNYFSKDAGFKVVTCRPYRPQTKGKVESFAKLVERLLPYNGEFVVFEDLEKIIDTFNVDINNEVSQGTNEKPIDKHKTEKEYLSSLPNMDALISYFHHEKQYKVSNESMITYKGQKYSVPLYHMGNYMTVEEKENDICIYWDEDLIVTHSKTNKFLNYKKTHVIDILRSDAFKHSEDIEIETFIENRLKKMDVFIDEGGQYDNI